MANEHHDYIESDAGEYGEAPVHAVVSRPVNQRKIDGERIQGYKDAIDDLGSRLACPVCYSLRYLETTEATIGYFAGWRLAMIEIKHDWAHTCPELYQLKEDVAHGIG